MCRAASLFQTEWHAIHRIADGLIRVIIYLPYPAFVGNLGKAKGAIARPWMVSVNRLVFEATRRIASHLNFSNGRAKLSTTICEVSRNAPPACLLPWRENPNRLVSLWDLVKVFEPRELLTRIRELSGIATLLMDSGLSATSRSQVLEQLSSKLAECQRTCTDLELRISALRIAQILTTLDHIKHLSGTTVAEAAERIKTDVAMTIENELSLHSFLRITPDRKEFFDEPRNGWRKL